MRIIRTGVMNNYCFTEAEEKKLKTFEGQGRIFVNSNAFPFIKPTYPSIITINPYLKFVEPEGDISNVKAFRVKVTIGATRQVLEEEKQSILYSIKNGIPVLITFMRWRKISSLEKFTNDYKRFYFYDRPWQRPKKEYRIAYRKNLTDFIHDKFPANTKNMIYFCDWNGRGCEECNNCVRLTYPEFIGSQVYSLNLSCSGDGGKCCFHCPDCWSHFCLSITKSKKPKLDTIYRNRKQKGLTVHE